MNTIKLICTTANNNNKFYNMFQTGIEFRVEYGRVGCNNPQIEIYPMSKWDSIYRAKVKKGYKDVTELFTESVSASKVDFLDIDDFYIKDLIAKLESYTKAKVSTNYKVSSDAVSERQIAEAQAILNAISNVKNNRELNRLLLEVFAVIPRKMAKVQDHLLDEYTDFSFEKLEDVLGKEQELLDTMNQQVQQTIVTKDNKNDKITLLDALGIEIFNVRPDQEKMVKNKLGSISDKYIRAFRVENKITEQRFKKYVDSKKNKTTNLFFHGSRNENWLPIMQNGLMLRPTNVVITGKMFGQGTYFADKAMKSFGYTSAKGSYWAKGSASEAYMALYNVHLGNQLHIRKHESWCSQMTEDKLKAKGDYDSLYAEGGFDLKNNEFIVYNENACTINYLVQLKG